MLRFVYTAHGCAATARGSAACLQSCTSKKLGHHARVRSAVPGVEVATLRRAGCGDCYGCSAATNAHLPPHG